MPLIILMICGTNILTSDGGYSRVKQHSNDLESKQSSVAHKHNTTIQHQHAQKTILALCYILLLAIGTNHKFRAFKTWEKGFELFCQARSVDRLSLSLSLHTWYGGVSLRIFMAQAHIFQPHNFRFIPMYDQHLNYGRGIFVPLWPWVETGVGFWGVVTNGL